LLVLLNVQSPIYPQPNGVSEHPHIRTFHARHGRMSARRELALNELLPRFEISSLERPINMSKVLNLEKVIIDFGSGMGDHSLNLATSCPHVGVLAIDVHTVGLLAVVEVASASGLSNILTHHGDGMDVFKDWLLTDSVDEVHVLFPDPWPKARHHKRRLITPLFLDLLTRILKPGGRLIFVTDDESYFESASTTISDYGKFDVFLNDWDITMTTYHRRALRLGNKISQLSAVKH
jgi:tRNA (guanine-N7-)-methyltransferase